MTEKEKLVQRKYEKGRYKRNPKFRNYAKSYSKNYQHLLRLEVLSLIGGLKCKRCGFSDWRGLQIDHINGDGKADRDKMGKSYKYYNYIKNNPVNYQVLCANCNWIKRYENKEYNIERFNNI